MKHLLLFIATFFLINAASAQSLGCAGATNINQTGGFSVTPSPEDTSINYGCVNATGQWVWYGYFTVCQGGTCTINVSTAGVDSIGIVVWGPFSSTAAICQNLTAGNVAACTSLVPTANTVSLGTIATGDIYMVCAISDSAWAAPMFQNTGTAVFNGTCSSPPPPGPGCTLGAANLNMTGTFQNNGSIEDTTIDYGCATAVNQWIWYGYFTVCSTGTLTVGGTTMTSANDLDIVVWGPFTSTTNICSQLTTPNIAGCSATPNATEMVSLGTVTQGQIYMIAAVVDTNTQIPSFNQTGTASINGPCFPPPPCYPVNGFEMLCVVTVDSATQEYKMVWNEIAGNPASHFGIYKTDIFQVPQEIDTVHITSLSEYIDYSADPNVHTEQYQIITYDTCGSSWASMGSYIQPVFCQSSLSTSNTVNVSWSHYIDNAAGYGPVYYVIYRGPTMANMTPIDTVAAFIQNYTDINPLSGTSYYKIGVALSAPCVPMRVIQGASVASVESFSNAAPITVVGVEENSLSNVSVFPNPANDVMNINGVWEQSTLNIYDVTGRLVMTQTLQNSASQQIGLSMLEQGAYVMTIENAHGFYRKEIVIQR